MGWMGRWGQVKHAIRTVGGDVNESGEVIVDGVAFFLGIKDEAADVVIGDNAVYYKDGEPQGLASLMNMTSYGIRNIQVIG